MRRAVELSALKTRSSRSSLVEETWQTRSTQEESFISVAAAHWEMVVTRQRGADRLTVRGPETRATTLPIPQDAEFFGIQFSVGTFMPGLPPGRLVDRTLTLPAATGGSFWLDGSVWRLPDHDTAEVLVGELGRAGLLVHEPVVAEARTATSRATPPARWNGGWRGRPAPPDPVAPAPRRADARADRQLGAGRVGVAGVQDQRHPRGVDSAR